MSFSKKKSRFGFSGKYCTIGICLSQFLVGYDNNRDKSRLEIKKERGGLVCIRTEEYELSILPPLLPFFFQGQFSEKTARIFPAVPLQQQRDNLDWRRAPCERTVVVATQ